MDERKCRVCGCTDSNCRRCIEKTGVPCYWAEGDLCSACAAELATEAVREKLKAGGRGA